MTKGQIASTQTSEVVCGGCGAGEKAVGTTSAFVIALDAVGWRYVAKALGSVRRAWRTKRKGKWSEQKPGSKADGRGTWLVADKRLDCAASGLRVDEEAAPLPCCYVRRKNFATAGGGMGGERMTTRFVLLLAVLVAIALLALPGEPEAAVSSETSDVGYLAVPVVWPVASPTAVTFVAEVSHYSCSVEEGTAACIEAHTGNRAGPGTAASRTLAAGTRLTIDGERYEVRDFCGSCRADGVDLWTGSREEALAVGRQKRVVTIEKGEGE